MAKTIEEIQHQTRRCWYCGGIAYINGNCPELPEQSEQVKQLFNKKPKRKKIVRPTKKSWKSIIPDDPPSRFEPDKGITQAYSYSEIVSRSKRLTDKS